MEDFNIIKNIAILAVALVSSVAINIGAVVFIAKRFLNKNYFVVMDQVPNLEHRISVLEQSNIDTRKIVSDMDQAIDRLHITITRIDTIIKFITTFQTPEIGGPDGNGKDEN